MSKPLPDLEDPATSAFWEGTRKGELLVQTCLDCGYRRWPPGPLCNECQSPRFEWRPVKPEGTLWSVATYHRALDPAFKEDVPYSVGLIELDEGPRMYGRLQGDPATFALDSRVHAAFREVAPGVSLVDWAIGPVEGGSNGVS